MAYAEPNTAPQRAVYRIWPPRAGCKVDDIFVLEVCTRVKSVEVQDPSEYFNFV
jgi:hypothetical protein